MWRPAGRCPSGTVCLLHGRAEIDREIFRGRCSELLSPAISPWRRFDWRGQGGSQTAASRNPHKGHVDDFVEYERDLDAFLQQVALPDCPPPYLRARSFNGRDSCALRVARRSRLVFERMVLTSPLVDFGSRAPSRRIVGLAAGSLALLGLGDAWPPGAALARVEGRAFENNPLTGDQKRFERNRAIARALPQVAIGPPTIGWLHAACRRWTKRRSPNSRPRCGSRA